MVDAAEGLGDGGGVGDHADGALDGGHVPPRNDRGGLVVDAALEARGAPVDELDGALVLDGGHGQVDVLGHHVAPVHEAARHVLAVAGIALGHHGAGLEDRVGDLGHAELLVVGPGGGDQGGVRGEHEVDAGVGDQVGLELVDVDVEGAVEAERRGEGGDDLRDEAVKVGVGGALDVEVAAAHVVEGLVVEAEGAVGVLEEGVGGEDGVVGLDDGRGDLRGWADGEAELGLAAVVHREALEEEAAQAGAGAAAGGVEDEEALQAGAVVGELADAVEDGVDDLLSDGVVAAGVVVGGVLLAGDDLLGMVELAVGAGPDLVAHGGLQVDVDGAGHVAAVAGLGEEGRAGVLAGGRGDARRMALEHGAVGLNPVLQAVQLPALVAGLDSGLAEVDADALAHVCWWWLEGGGEREREGRVLRTHDKSV